MNITNSNQLHDHLYKFIKEEVEKYDFATWIKIMKILAHFQPIFNFELKGKRSRAELSLAENRSARALTWASKARTHLLFTIVIVGELYGNMGCGVFKWGIQN